MTDNDSKTRQVEDHTLQTSDGLGLFLRRYPEDRSSPAKSTVLLLHGASAASRTFEVPRRHNLIDFLRRRNCEVWALDWRSSFRVVQNHVAEYEKFTLDEAAKQDLPAALAYIQQRMKEKAPIGVFAHCMGAGALSMAIGAGMIGKEQVDCIVLSTLGLFYESSWDGWVKAEDRILERIRGNDRQCRFIDSDWKRTEWPLDMEGPYERWPATLLPPTEPGIYRRLAFMFGRPYYANITPSEIHNDEALSGQFGPMPLKLYMQCGQNVRRGFAASFGEMDWTPARRGPHASTKSLAEVAGTYLNVRNFEGLKVMLVTGDRNQLWHPDSVHRMYDWLRRELSGQDCKKRIFEGYAHQDLLWGERSDKEVYPTIAAGLGI